MTSTRAQRRRTHEDDERHDDAMVRLQSGDPNAMAEIALEWSSVLVHYFGQKLDGKDPQAAEDLSQDVLVRIWTCRAQYIPGGKFRSWVFTIASNMLVDHIRREKRRKRLTIASPGHFDVGSNVASQARTPFEEASNAEEGENLAMLVAELSAEQAAVCVDYYWRNENLPQIAARIGRPLATVKSRIQNGRATLRRWMAADDHFADVPGIETAQAKARKRSRCLIQTPDCTQAEQTAASKPPKLPNRTQTAKSRCLNQTPRLDKHCTELSPVSESDTGNGRQSHGSTSNNCTSRRST